MATRRLRQRNVQSSVQEAIQYCTEGKDKGYLEKRFINENIGWGVFTTKKRTKGEFLLEYTGEIISHKDADSREALYKEQGQGNFLFYFGKLCVDATEDNGRLGRLVNDGQGEEENCNMKTVKVDGPSKAPRLCLFARRDITKGEELRYDYGVADLPWRQSVPHIKAAEQDKGKDKEDEFTEVSECPQISSISEQVNLQLHPMHSTSHKTDQSETQDAGKPHPRNYFDIMRIQSTDEFDAYFNSCESSYEQYVSNNLLCSQQLSSNTSRQTKAAIDSDVNLCESSNKDVKDNPSCSQQLSSNTSRQTKAAIDSDINLCESSNKDVSDNPSCSQQLSSNTSRQTKAAIDSDVNLCESSNKDVSDNPSCSQQLSSNTSRQTKAAIDSDVNLCESSNKDVSDNPSCSQQLSSNTSRQTKAAIDSDINLCESSNKDVSDNPSCSQQLSSNTSRQTKAAIDSDINLCESSNKDVSDNPSCSQQLSSNTSRQTKAAIDSDVNLCESSNKDVSDNPSCSQQLSSNTSRQTKAAIDSDVNLCESSNKDVSDNPSCSQQLSSNTSRQTKAAIDSDINLCESSNKDVSDNPSCSQQLSSNTSRQTKAAIDSDVNLCESSNKDVSNNPLCSQQLSSNMRRHTEADIDSDVNLCESSNKDVSDNPSCSQQLSSNTSRQTKAAIDSDVNLCESSNKDVSDNPSCSQQLSSNTSRQTKAAIDSDINLCESSNKDVSDNPSCSQQLSSNTSRQTKAAIDSDVNLCESSNKDVSNNPLCSQQLSSNMRRHTEADIDSDFNPFEYPNEQDVPDNPSCSQQLSSNMRRHTEADIDSDFNPFEYPNQQDVPDNRSCSQQLSSNMRRHTEADIDSDFNPFEYPNQQDVPDNPSCSQQLSSNMRRHTEADIDSDFNPFEYPNQQDVPSSSQHTKRITRKRKKKQPSKFFSDSKANVSDSSDDENTTQDFPTIQDLSIDSEELIGISEDPDVVPPSDCSIDAADDCKSRFDFPNMTLSLRRADSCPVQVAQVNSINRVLTDDNSDSLDNSSDQNFDPNYDEDHGSSSMESEDDYCSEKVEEKQKKNRSKFEKTKKVRGTKSSSLPEVVSSSTSVLKTTKRKKSDIFSDHLDDDSSSMDSEESSSSEKVEVKRKKKRPKFEKGKKVLGTESSSLPQVVSSTISVLTTTNRKDKRSWDRHNICVYCEEGFSKLPRHFERNHASEKEVAYILSKNKNSKERKLLWQLLTNKGNHVHNLEVISSGQGDFIPAKRKSYMTVASDYLPCEHCLGHFIRSDLWKHHKCCPALKLSGVKSSKGRVQGRSAMLLPVPKTSNEAFNVQVLQKMNIDTIGLTVREDELICKFGLKLFMKFSEPHQFGYCAQRMRQLGRLVVTMKEEFPEKLSSLKDAIQPQHFCDVVEAVRQTAGFDPVTKQYKTPSLALQIGFSLRAVAAILKGEALKTGDKTQQEAAECFDKLCGLEWSGEVSHNALVTLEKRKWNKPQMLPLGEDVVKLSRHLKEVSKKHSQLLDACPSDSQSWYTLAKSTLAQLILFNRRRSGEVERLLLEECNNITMEENEDVLRSLSKWEQSLCKKLKRLEIRGKRGRKVPVLMSEALHYSVKKLISTRKDVDVSDANIYLFARPFPSQHAIRGQDCIRQFSVECGVSHPENITSTRLRKQIGTLSQVFNLQDNELDILATFMGHDIAVHRNYYRLPEQTLQLVKVSRILLAMESGQTLDFSGKSLDEIEIDIDDSGEKEESGNHFVEEEESDADTEADKIGRADSENHFLEEEKADHGLQRKKVTKKVAKKKAWKVTKKIAKKKAWNSEETKAVLRHFQKHVHLHRVPGKRECEACLEKEPILHERQWKGIKYKVYNLIQEQKRKGK